ncbi:SPW repeat protein [Marinithermus hydrothermalis]|uniref:SPW repeat protein n=1 Tax=Marinithermus hydrothermalis (strain DSM 14884 / JCM 11576 / T1) TaxID=869210 RepID=F2NMG6_MARHT|nr:SPW repeat protein [Marinithermus hydrothermalis]AEB12136.1 SPW repeat protein [Marinithermus hydrothermalis DSM 14884]
MKRWQDWGSLVLGIWLVLSPWLLGYSTTPSAFWNALIVGAAVTILSILALSGGQLWEEWTDLVLAVWLILSPWILNFTANTAAFWNAVIVGVLIGVLALWVTRQHPRPA